MMANYCLMPSEIARLIYGYLLETKCNKTAQCFLEESPFLHEFAQGIKNGYPFSTTPFNLTLLQILNGQWNSNKVASNNDKDVFFVCNNEINSNISTSINGQYIINKENHVKTSQTPFTQKVLKHQVIAYSPRRKNATPKRCTSVLNTNSSDIGEIQAHSSPFSTNPESSEVEIEIPKQAIFNELLKCGPLHNKVANKIQKFVFKQDDASNSNLQTDNNNVQNKPDELNVGNNNYNGNIEKDLLPQDTVNDIIRDLTHEPEFNELVNMIVDKEIISYTPFKEITTPSTSTNSSLNTPIITFGSINENESKEIPVKNLLKDLQTPEKKIQLSLNNINNNNCINDKLVGQMNINKIELGTTKVKPILQSNNNSKFYRTSKSNIEVQNAVNKQNNLCAITTSTSANSTKNASNKLTTTIEIIDNQQNKTNTSDNQLTVLPTEQQIPIGISSITNWPELNNQAYIIQNNQLTWNNNDVYYLQYAPQDVVYINQPKIVTTNNSIIPKIDNTFISILPNDVQTTESLQTKETITILDDTPSRPSSQPQQVQPQSQESQAQQQSQSQQQTSSQPALQAQQQSQSQSASQSPNQTSLQQPLSSQNKSYKPPNILSRKQISNNTNNASNHKLKNSSIQNKNQYFQRTSNVKDNSNSKEEIINNNHKQKRKSEPLIRNDFRPNKRLNDSFNNDNGNKNKKTSSDDKIKSLLNSDIDKFLGNIHNNL